MSISNYEFYKNILMDFTTFFEYSNLCTKNILQGICFEFLNNHIIDTNFKYSIDIEKPSKLKSQKDLKIIKFDTVFNDLDFIFINEENNLRWFLINLAIDNKLILEGTILCRKRNVFIVGIFGFPCLLHKNHFIQNIRNIPKLKSLFLVSFVDDSKNLPLVSQRKALKRVKRILYKVRRKIRRKIRERKRFLLWRAYLSRLKN